MTKEERAEWLELAYEMAWFIHRNKQVAYLIALEVVYRWEVMPPQGQRLLSKEQKFQRLIFEVSEYFEKAVEAINAGDEVEINQQVLRLVVNLRHLEAPEQSIATIVRKYISLLTPLATNLEDRTMMTRYLKHLAMIALRHSLVKTTVSYAQLLYRFPTSETRSIYEHLETSLEQIGEVKKEQTGGVKDLQFFAKARRELIEDLKTRFGSLLRIEPCQAPNGATTYQIAASSATPDQTDFAKECLREFAPPDVRRSSSTPDSLGNKGEFVYQVSYPEQFQIVLAEAGLPACPQPLFWPVFANIQRPAGPPSSRPSRPLRDREVRAALSLLSLKAKRRRRWNWSRLQIVVDGRESAQLDLDKASQTTLFLDADARTIEVLGRLKEGNVLLAQHLLSEEELDPEHGPSKYVMPLEGGQKLTFDLAPRLDEAGGDLTIRYLEPAIAQFVRKFRKPAASFFPLINWKSATAFAAPLLTILLGLVVSETLMTSRTITRKDIPIPKPASPQASAKGSSHGPTLGRPDGSSSSSPSEMQTPPLLNEISKLRIKVIGENPELNQVVETRLVRRLSTAAAKLTVINDKTKTDATLKVVADWRYGILGRISDTAVLEVGLYSGADDESNEAIWPRSTHGRQYQGSSEDVVDAIAQDLIDARRDSIRN